MNYRKKLIEVALPLDAINKASAREKSIRQGHPSTLHLWWARRPLAAARAVIFAQMVDDPSTYVDVLHSNGKLMRKAKSVLKSRIKIWEEATKTAEKAAEFGISAPDPGPKPDLDEILAELERDRLFKIIEELVKWKNTTNEEVLQKARDEIWQSWRRTCADNADHPRAKELFDRNKLPAFHDPFAGGGALPLEAQRLGLESYASDLNPVAVLINKAMIEIPPKFAGQPPVNPEARKDERLVELDWPGAKGLAEDVRYYGKWMRDEAEKRIGHLYPKVEVTAEMAEERPDLKPYVGRSLNVNAWIWVRTVKSPNPAYSDVEVPLASTFMLSTKSGKEAYIEPVIAHGNYHFDVKMGKPKDITLAKRGTKISRGANFECIMSGTPITGQYIRTEGKAGRMKLKLMTIIAEGERGRVFLAPTPIHEAVVMKAVPEWRPEIAISGSTQYLGVKPYGIDTFDQLFSNRQLVALTSFSELIHEAYELVKSNALAVGLPDDGKALKANGTGATAYADAVRVYLSLSVSKLADRCSTICSWALLRQHPINTFSRQAIPMTWDFAESNPIGASSGNYMGGIKSISNGISSCNTQKNGLCIQADATKQTVSQDKVIATDPPYYDNVPYADLSDFFYVWLRFSLSNVFPELFTTLAVPKAEELVAFAYRHNSKADAETFFLVGMTSAMEVIAKSSHSAFPVTIYYAFKQSESNAVEGIASTGWETFLEAVIQAGFSINGTWPIRTEVTNKLKSTKGALASSIVLVCRPKTTRANVATRRDFVTSLKSELPIALNHLQRGNIAPVDLAQAAIGPGMSVYTRFSKVLDAEGKPLTVRMALALINQVLDEVLAEQEGDFDADTRWALSWFEQYGFSEAEYGVAETLSKAKNTSVSGLVEAGILYSRRGKVRLLSPEELSEDWDPESDKRLTVWEMVHQLIKKLDEGELAASVLSAKLGSQANIARELAYRLYNICERSKRAQEALSYNSLVQSWPEIERLAREYGAGEGKRIQPTFFSEE